MAQEPETKLPSNESTNPTLKPLCVDRTPLEGAALCAVAFGAWGLGAVTLGSWCVVRWPCSGMDDHKN